MDDDKVTDFSREEKLREIAREIAMRRRVYQRRIAHREMTVADAERAISIMLAIAKDYGGHGGQR
jgi:hypothetical protein